MQQVTDAELAVLTARNVIVDAGCDLLDEQDNVVADLSADLVPEGSQVERNNYATVHGTCSLQLLRQLDWRTARVRPYMLASVDGETWHRWNLGVYLLTTPEQPIGDTPAVWDVDGYDKLHLLQHSVGDSYVVDAGTSYLDAVRQVLTDSGYTGLAARLDGDAEGKLLDTPMVWLLDDDPTWLRIANDLLGAIGYRGLWVDQDGRFRSEPYQAPSVRAPEWVWDADDELAGVVAEERTYTVDEYEQLNWWRFVRDGMDVEPVEGAGFYTVDRSDGVRLRRSVQRVTAADQASLVANGDRLVDEATQRARALDVRTGPMPVLGHMDVTEYRDSALGTFKCVTVSHTIPLDGSDCELELEVVDG